MVWDDLKKGYDIHLIVISKYFSKNDTINSPSGFNMNFNVSITMSISLLNYA